MLLHQLVEQANTIVRNSLGLYLFWTTKARRESLDPRPLIAI